MNKKLIVVITGFLMLVNINLVAQKSTLIKKDTIVSSGSSLMTILNLRPVLLTKGQSLLSFRVDFPNIYKVYNPATGKLEKLSPVVALSEMYFNSYATYGLSDRWNLFAMIPVADIHHFSPMGEVSGVGFGDVEAGADYRIFKGKKDEKSSLAARMTLGFPTGHFKHLSDTQYPLGLGSFRIRAAVTGLYQYTKVQMIYSAYYEYRTNRLGVRTGDQTGGNLIFRKPIETAVGRFGLEGGSYAYWNFSDKKNGEVVPLSQDYAVILYVGAWYQYLKKLDIRFGVPYNIYQNKSWITQYRIQFQIDYLL